METKYGFEVVFTIRATPTSPSEPPEPEPELEHAAIPSVATAATEHAAITRLTWPCFVVRFNIELLIHSGRLAALTTMSDNRFRAKLR
jgi:hypothetical protein